MNPLLNPLEIEKYGRHSNARYTILGVLIATITVFLFWIAFTVSTFVEYADYMNGV